MSEDIFHRAKLAALWRVAQFRPVLTVGIIVLSVFAAILEGIGLSFLLPIIQQARGAGEPTGVVEVFFTVYEFLRIPFTLEFIIFGVAFVMALRYVSSFLVDWLRALLQETYVRELQTQSFENALDAKIEYFDRKGSDDILNAIVTQARQAGTVIQTMVQIVEQSLLSLMYFLIALLLAPWLTIGTAVILGGFTYLLRSVLESGYSVGDRVAVANERVQTATQAGTQGIRDVKLFGLSTELFDDFRDAADQYVVSRVGLRRNQAVMNNFYQLMTAITVFVLIYAALRLTGLSLEALGVFLFAMFRLAPRVSSLNNMIYKIEGNLPHLVRTQRFVEELKEKSEPTTGDRPVPDPVQEVTVDGVSFSYDENEQVLNEISFAVERGEFIAFVGASGAGKSTVVSLLARMYESDSGTIRADGISIDEFDVDEWREHLAVVRQSPYVFNDTLRYNVTIANRDATDEQIERVCEIAQVNEFLEDLPNGYRTQLGDDGVRLSGGQKQRVALARALLREADLLLLDEATSDLDTNIEQDVHDAIEGLERDRAMVVIAHRLSTVRNADRIYVMDDGEIVEIGTHEELLSKGGTYADLYSTQGTTQEASHQ